METPSPRAITLHSPHNPWQPPIPFLSLWICPFWTFHIDGLMRRVGFGDWLLSLCMMFLRFILAALFTASLTWWRKPTVVLLRIGKGPKVPDVRKTNNNDNSINNSNGWPSQSEHHVLGMNPVIFFSSLPGARTTAIPGPQDTGCQVTAKISLPPTLPHAHPQATSLPSALALSSLCVACSFLVRHWLAAPLHLQGCPKMAALGLSTRQKTCPNLNLLTHTHKKRDKQGTVFHSKTVNSLIHTKL